MTSHSERSVKLSRRAQQNVWSLFGRSYVAVRSIIG